jgi:chaperone BCS1
MCVKYLFTGEGDMIYIIPREVFSTYAIVLAGLYRLRLSFAIAGYFKLKIYIVSLNSLAMNEENLGTLFAELPKQCVVLLEDIDTAGLTHARQAPAQDDEEAKPKIAQAPGTTTTNPANPPTNNGGRISLSALLNIIDGVAATEGRILIMTTNHLEKLDPALIRPGRVDMTIKFDLATTDMITTIFRGIFATLEGDVPNVEIGVVIRSPQKVDMANSHASKLREEEEDGEKEEAAIEAEKKAEEAKVFELGAKFAEIIPNMTFSPAEIQGYLLKHKRAPEMAVKNAAEWVVVRKAEQIREREKAQDEKQRMEKEEKT